MKAWPARNAASQGSGSRRMYDSGSAASTSSIDSKPAETSANTIGLMTSVPRDAQRVNMASDQSRHSESSSSTSMSTFESTSVDFIGLVSEQTQQFLAAHSHRRTVRLQVADDSLAARRCTAPGSDHGDAAFDREVDLGVREKPEALAD